MTRTMFDSRGFRPGASTLGHGAVMGNVFTDAWKKYTQAYLNPTPTLKVTPTAAAAEAEPTILGIPQKTALIGGAVILGVGLVAALFG